MAAGLEGEALIAAVDRIESAAVTRGVTVTSQPSPSVTTGVTARHRDAPASAASSTLPVTSRTYKKLLLNLLLHSGLQWN